MGRKHPRSRTPPPVPRRSSRLWAVSVPAGLALAAFAAYLPALSARFVNFDDDRLFLANGSRFREPLPTQLHWMFTSIGLGDYQPLAWLSSSLDYRISGLNPVSYHAGNLLLHAASAVLLYFITIRLLRAGFALEPDDRAGLLHAAAAVAALLWAVHPLRVESVAWAAERRDTLSVMLLLACVLAYLRACSPEKATVARKPWYWASCGLLLLSLLSKAWGMTLFLSLAVIDIFPLRRLPADPRRWAEPAARRVWIQKIPFAVLGAAFGAVAVYAQRMTPAALMPLGSWTVRDRLLQSAYGLLFYVRRTVWPVRLAVLYERPQHLYWLQPACAISVLALAAGTIAVAALARRLPGLAAAGAVYVFTVSPVLGLAQSGPQLVADRYSYPSMIPWMVLAGAGLFRLWQGKRTGVRAASVTIVAAVCTTLFVLTVRQTRVWHDSASLWSHALAVGASSSIAHLNYGEILRLHGDNAGAIAQYEAAVAIRPDYGNAWYNLGNALTAAHAYGRAEHAYQRAIAYMERREFGYMNLGNLYLIENRLPAAIVCYRQATAFVDAHESPAQSPEPYLALGNALLQEGRIDEARPPLTIAASIPATAPAARRLLAWIGRRDAGRSPIGPPAPRR